MMELLNVLQQEPWLFTCLVFVFSLIIGSFLNVIIYRLPIIMEREWRSEFQAYFQSEQAATPNSAYNLAVPRSACPICNTPIAAKDNIPLFSWLLLKGRCRHCQTPISIRYPAVELLTAILSTVLAWQFGPTFTALLLIFLTWGLIALSFIDIDKMLLPDQLTLPLLWLVLLFSLSDAAFITPAQAIIGAAVGYLSLWCVYWAFKLLTGKEGMGYGDFKLLAIFGALLGWQQLILIILLSSVVGAIIGASLLALQGKDKATPIPFGPYIAVAGWVAIIGGEQITKAYLGYIGL
jgi:leader peptidase (prepilin peptidase)/N-methyltransferase